MRSEWYTMSRVIRCHCHCHLPWYHECIMLPEKYDYEYYQKLLLKLLRMHNIERSQIIVMKCMRRMCSNDTLCILGEKTHIQSDDKTLFLCDCRLKTSSTADLQALNFIAFYYIHRYLLFILVYFDAVIDVVIVGRCCCHFSPFTLAFFLFFSLLLLFLTLFPWYISFWQQKHIYISI